MKFGKQPAPVADINEDELEVHKPKTGAAGVKAVMVALERAVAQAGVTRTAQTLLRLNQVDGFDCPGCAWPEPRRAPAHRRVLRERRQGGRRGGDPAAGSGRSSSPQHTIAELAEQTDYWLGQQGRLTEPMVMRRRGRRTTSRSAGTTRSR